VAHDLATAVEGLAQTNRVRVCPPAPARVLRWDPPPSDDVDLRLTLPRSTTNASRRPRSLDGEGAPHRLLQPTSRHVHLRVPRDSRGGLRLRSRHARWGETPAGDSSHGALDGAPRASTDAYRAFALGEDGHPRILAGLRSEEPSKGVPRSAAFSSADEACAPTSDAPSHDVPAPKRRPAARTAFPTVPSRTMAPTTRGAFHRRVPARPPPLSER
jgi:hypothetical protein